MNIAQIFDAMAKIPPSNTRDFSVYQGTGKPRFTPHRKRRPCVYYNRNSGTAWFWEMGKWATKPRHPQNNP